MIYHSYIHSSQIYPAILLHLHVHVFTYYLYHQPSEFPCCHPKSHLRRLLDFIHSPFTVGIATAAPRFAKEKWVYLGLTKLGQPPIFVMEFHRSSWDVEIGILHEIGISSTIFWQRSARGCFIPLERQRHLCSGCLYIWIKNYDKWEEHIWNANCYHWL